MSDDDRKPALDMETLVSLCKRRGFIFQSSEIYGGLQGAWDYGPLGVEMANNIKRAWWRAIVQERDDIVGLDASILMHPEVWRPAATSRRSPTRWSTAATARARFRADELDSDVCPNCGQTRAVHRAAHVQPDAADVPRPGAGRRGDGVPAAGDGAGHLRQLRERRRRRCAASCRSASRRSASRSATRSRRATSSSASASWSRWRWSTSATRRTRCELHSEWIENRRDWYARFGMKMREPPRPRAREGGAVALLAGDVGLRVPLPDGLGRAGGRGASRRLRPHAAREGTAASSSQLLRRGAQGAHRAARHRAGARRRPLRCWRS